MVTLNAKNCFIKDNKRIDLWRSKLTKALDAVNAKELAKRKQGKNSEDDLLEQQFVYTDKCMVGCYLAVFLKRKLAGRLKPKSL